jgi:hypothetical protein
VFHTQNFPVNGEFCRVASQVAQAFG